MSPDDPRHGSYGGYQRHRKDAEEACAPCREANNAYTKKMRSDPRIHQRDREASKAGSRAAWRLVAQYRDEYERFYAEELTAIRSTHKQPDAVIRP